MVGNEWEETDLCSVGAEQHGRQRRRQTPPVGRSRPSGVSSQPFHSSLLSPMRLGGSPRASPPRHRHHQDLRRRPGHGLCQRPPPPPLGRGGPGAGTVRHRRHRHKRVGAGIAALRGDGAKGYEGGRARRRWGDQGGALVPGGERHDVAWCCGSVRGQHREAYPGCPIGSLAAFSAVHPGESGSNYNFFSFPFCDACLLFPCCKTLPWHWLIFRSVGGVNMSVEQPADRNLIHGTTDRLDRHHVN